VGIVDVVLINSPIILYESEDERKQYSSHGGDEVSYYPLGILYIASYLEQEGHSVAIIDVSAEGLTLPQVLAKVDELKPKIVGISTMTTGIQSAIILGKALRPKYLVGIGGVHINIDHTFIDRFPYFDFCIIGEGEYTFEKILKKIKKGNKTDRIYYGQTVENLDDLPFPARHLINHNLYKREEQFKFEIPAAGILASRGCPYNCIFCCIPNRGKKVRFRSAKNIVDEMESLYETCQGNYSFVDDCFTINRINTLHLCDEIIKRGLKTRWIASTRVELLNESMAYSLSKAGCRELYFGVESGSERVRNNIIGKNLYEGEIKKAVHLCKKYKILSNFFLMLGHPTETKEEIEETIKIGNRAKADAIGVHITRPMPGSDLFEIAIKEGQVNRTVIDDYASGKLGKRFRENFPVYVPVGMSKTFLLKMRKRAYRKFYLSPQFILRRIRIWLTVKGRFKEDLKLFKIAPGILMRGGSKGQLS